MYQQATALDKAFNPLPSGASTKPYWYGDLGVRLKPEAAQAFQREQGLYERYRQGADDEGEGYFFFAGLAPT